MIKKYFSKRKFVWHFENVMDECFKEDEIRINKKANSKTKSKYNSIREFIESKDDEKLENMSVEESNYPISRQQAINIAKENENLKSDFLKLAKEKKYSYFSFSKIEAEIFNKDDRTYWMIQVVDGNLSWVEFAEDGETIFVDGTFTEEEFKQLRCLIDVETGEYIYYPDNASKNKNFIPEYELYRQRFLEK